MAKIFTLLAAGLLLACLTTSVIALILPWWTGACSGTITGIGECQSATGTLWTIMMVGVQQTEAGPVTTEMSFSWDNDVCADVATTEGTACASVVAARAMTILAMIFAFTGLVAIIVARFTTPLLLVAGAFGAILTAVFAAVGCGMGVMATTAGNGMGIGGVGFISLGVTMVFGAGATAVSFYTAAQSMREEDLGDGHRVPREVRAAEARAKAAQAAAVLEEHAQKSGASTTSSQRKKKQFTHLRQVLFWNDSKGVHDDDEEIPTELLEKAFREIDENGGGSIDMTELVDALRSCGLNANMTAAEIVMKDIDKNASGDVDIHEFVEFFRYTEELKKMDKKNKRRAQFLSIICNGCFVMHVFGVSALLMLFVKMDKDENPQTYTLTRTLFMFFCVNLGLLCAFVIVLRALTITLGPQWVIWQGYYEKHLNDAAKNLQKIKAQPRNDGGLRQAAWATKGPVAGLPGPGAVNAAKYGASWRRPKALLPGEETGEFTGTQTGLGGTGYASTQGGGHGTEGSGQVHTGIILNRDGGFERYDPASYWQAQRLAMDKDAPRSFNTMQVHSISRPQEDIRQQAFEVQMLALPGYANAAQV